MSYFQATPDTPAMLLGTLALSLLLGACDATHPASPGRAGPESSPRHASAASQTLTPEQAAAFATQLSRDPLAYLTQLGLIRARLLVAVQLIELGAIDAADWQLRDARERLLLPLATALSERGRGGLAIQLEALDNQAAGTSLLGLVADATAAIARAEAEAGTLTPALINAVVVSLLRYAATDYTNAVSRGRLISEHHYHSAYGNLEVAKLWVASIDPQGDSTVSEVTLQLRQELDLLAGLWPSLDAPQRLNSSASQLVSAAARAKIIGLRLTPIPAG